MKKKTRKKKHSHDLGPLQKYRKKKKWRLQLAPLTPPIINPFLPVSPPPSSSSSSVSVFLPAFILSHPHAIFGAVTFSFHRRHQPTAPLPPIVWLYTRDLGSVANSLVFSIRMRGDVLYVYLLLSFLLVLKFVFLFFLFLWNHTPVDLDRQIIIQGISGIVSHSTHLLTHISNDAHTVQHTRSHDIFRFLYPYFSTEDRDVNTYKKPQKMKCNV